MHTPICPSRDKDADSRIIDCLYLYREFSSEAVRILLPITTFAGSDTKQTSFVAAIQLGLKRKFGGKVDHLRVMSYEEPVAGSGARKHFLMLYDTVPGGTGYLKDLMRSGEELMAVFQEALTVLTTCRCNHDPERDGCYRCIYAYRNSHEMQSTSRDTAVALLSQIIEHRDALQPVKTLGEIKVNVLFDSELEVRFIEALKRPQIPRTILHHDIIHGRPGYFLKVGDRSYTIEPQVDIGFSAVAVASRPDFLIRSARAQDGFRPVAVFTDGFEYHRDKAGDDTRERMALVRSGHFLQWSLSWNDVEAAFAGTRDHTVDYFAAGRTAPVDPDIAELQQRLWQALGATGLEDLKRLSSLELLLRFLASPECNRWKAAAFIESLVWFDPKAMREAATVERFSSSLASAVVSGLNDRFASLSKPTAVGGFGRWNGKPGWPISAFSAISLEGIETPDPNRLFVAIHQRCGNSS